MVKCSEVLQCSDVLLCIRLYILYVLLHFVRYALLLLCLYIVIVMYVLFCIFCFHPASWHSSATLTEVFRAFSSVVRQMPGYNSHRVCIVLCIVCFVSFYVLFVCKCVL